MKILAIFRRWYAALRARRQAKRDLAEFWSER